MEVLLMNPRQSLEEALKRALAGGVKARDVSKHAAGFKRPSNARALLKRKRKTERQARNKHIIKAKRARQRHNAHAKKVM